jgi:hypothetical protein
MSPSRSQPATQIDGPEDPNDPPPEQDPTHDVPVFPEGDPPPSPETAIRVTAMGPGEHDLPDEGEDDVDEDDLDPQKPHSPPDGGKGRVIFDEDSVAR